MDEAAADGSKLHSATSDDEQIVDSAVSPTSEYADSADHLETAGEDNTSTDNARSAESASSRQASLEQATGDSTEAADTEATADHSNVSDDAPPTPPPKHASVEPATTNGTRQSLEPPLSATGLPGLVFMTGAVDKLLATREGKRRDAKAALEKMQQVLQPRAHQPTWLSRDEVEVVLEAFHMLCVAQSSAGTLVVALDCIEKLVSFHYFDNATGFPEASTVASRLRSNYAGATGDAEVNEARVEREAEAEAKALRLGYLRSVADRLVAMVARCYQGEGTADTVQLQIVKALFALISSEQLPVRQSSMLSTIRTAHSVFFASRSQGNQTIAQGTLTQMVHLVLSRVTVSVDSGEDEEEEGAREGSDWAARDAFYLIRALCKLSMRQIPNDHAADARSPHLRSRCLALNLIRLALAEHTAVFVSSYVYLRTTNDETRAKSAGAPGGGAEDEFGDTEGPDQAISQEIAQSASRQQQQQLGEENEEQEQQHQEAQSTVAVPLISVVRQYISLSLSRNLVSPHVMVLDLGLAVFELTMQHARAYLRREMEVIFGEILLPLLETKSTGSLYHRGRVLQTVERLVAQPSLVVELYLNYDCSEDSQVNVFQRLAECLCKLGANHIAAPTSKSSPHYWVASAGAESTAEGAAALAAAWRSVQQRPTVFNMPLGTADRAVGAEGPAYASARASASSMGPGLDGRRESRTFSMGGGQDIGATLSFASSDRSAMAGAATDEYAVRQWAMDALATLLQSMVVWSDRLADPSRAGAAAAAAEDVDGGLEDEAAAEAAAAAAAVAGGEGDGGVAGDDPQELSSIKQRKQQYELGCKLFAWKASKGIEAWRKAGLIRTNEPGELARFLGAATNKGIDKLQLGEYLGEGDAYNIAVMHAFVDQMDFSGVEFVAALRQFLQAFRLPGEGQKIDRFMLKFAERYVIGNPGTGFANADTAYVLAYSTVMLNTDRHSQQVRNRMSKQEFINNNRGINDGSDVDAALLGSIYDQVDGEEIKMKDDPLERRVQDGGGGGASAGGALFVLWGAGTANRMREQYAHASAAMAAKSEQSIRSMARMQRRQQQQQQRRASVGTLDASALVLDTADYLHATRAAHVAAMFGLVWAAVLAAASSPLQTSADPHVVGACLVALQAGVALACRFRMALERATFVSTLRKFAQLQAAGDALRRKHVEAVRALVEVAASRGDVGDGLGDSWADVLQCVSQLERLQPALADGGADGAAARARLEAASQAVVVAVDRLFAASEHLSAAGIVDFVRALSQAAWAEVTATPPRLFSLTRIVEVAYYNMGRIRVEWSQIWAVLGPLFDRVGAHGDTRTALFALDSLRQLSMKFLEKEELPHFAFQKEFLRPFADVLDSHVRDVLVKDMVLRCVLQLVQAAARHMRSGWKAILHVAQIAARDPADAIAEMGFNIARTCAEHHAQQMWALVPPAAAEQPLGISGLEYYHALAACLAEYAATARRPRFALGAVDTLRGVAAKLGAQVVAHADYDREAAEKAPLDAQPLHRVTQPVLRALHGVVMAGDEDVEVRARALDAFFALLMEQGGDYTHDQWASVLRSLVFGMFADLQDASASRRFATVDDLELWFSTTLVKALRHVVSLFTRYHPDRLPAAMLSEVLELLALCIEQPSEVLGRIGTSCLQDLVRANFRKWDDDAWRLACDTIARLFNWSQPRELFAIAGASGSAGDTQQPPPPKKSAARAHEVSRPSPLRSGDTAASLLVDSADAAGTENGDLPSNAVSTVVGELPLAKPDYEHITLKCILQLLLIQTLGELFGASVDGTPDVDASGEGLEFYQHMSAHHLLMLLDCLDQSREFAHRFNGDRRVRRRLVEMGVMPTMPSLLKQETSSALIMLHILRRMQKEGSAAKDGASAEKSAAADEVDDRMASLMRAVLEQYCDAIPGDSSDGAQARVVRRATRVVGMSEAAAKRAAVVVAAWRPAVTVVVEHLCEMEGRAFAASVRALWPEIVGAMGTAAALADLDVVESLQLLLVAAGRQFDLSDAEYRIE
ncbi:guanine nucleotide exchange protein for ADP-robosylation factor [Coemansia interrupta]|uniref:Guanine nucleotide exchange protein for ADP-robosylation factor n=1 Tax=Coemansia interrupta TaxID=1126814 RepID=A0A9W8HE10_9FUNG|nr:guanine nucleotide exchange protein for ADP-robosylation factor [Coemansia interrupta]